jgi:hypothetical protein
LLSEYVVADPTIGIQQERLPDPVAKDLEDDEGVRQRFLHLRDIRSQIYT